MDKSICLNLTLSQAKTKQKRNRCDCRIPRNNDAELEIVREYPWIQPSIHKNDMDQYR